MSTHFEKMSISIQSLLSKFYLISKDQSIFILKTIIPILKQVIFKCCELTTQYYQSQSRCKMFTKAIRFNMSFTYPCPRKLREIMKISLIERESTSRIEQIWREYHGPRPNNICAIIDKHKYQFFYNRASSAPFFLLPVFRKGGHFKLITQWQKDCFLGTFLEDFKRKGSNAQPYVVYTFFTQLLAQKDIVLVRGDIINNSLDKAQAEKNWSMLQEIYCNQSKFELVHNFNNNTSMFSEQQYNETFGITV